MYHIDFAEEAELLRCIVKGQQSLEADAAIDAEIANACVARGTTALLVDIRALEGRLSVTENHLAARGFRQRMPVSLRKVAIVDHSLHTRASEMFELTAQNRGVDVRFFASVSEARAWLQLPGG